MGTYAHGDSLHFESWDKLPDEFGIDITNQVFFTKEHCSSNTWSPLGLYLMGNVSRGCTIILSTQVDNVGEGSVSFQYNHMDPELLAVFEIRNNRCAQIPNQAYLLPHSYGDYYLTANYSIPKGVNYLQWYLMAPSSYQLGRNMAGLMQIRRIDLSGSSSRFHCDSCPPGTFSDQLGSSKCQICPANTRSLQGADSCSPCQPNQYSPPDSHTCSPRLPCKAEDYIESWLPCNKDGMTRKRWQWIEPRICDDASGVQLPPNGELEACTKCPVGTLPTNSTHCQACGTTPRGDSSPQHSQQCVTCSSQTTPINGLEVVNWLRQPPMIKFWCEDDFSSTLTIYIFKQSLTGREIFLAHWIDSIEYEHTRIVIDDARPTKFIWIFEHYEDFNPWNSQRSYDHLELLQISVRNTVNITTTGCRTCVKGVRDGKCIPCPDGEFYSHHLDKRTHQLAVNCSKCPANSIVIADASQASTVDEACAKCQPGTVAVDHSYCKIDNLPVLGDNGVKYNLTELLAHNQTFTGKTLFTPAGVGYRHIFHLTLGHGDKVHCASSTDPSEYSEGQLCRYTSIDSSGQQQAAIAKPITLGQELVKVVPSNEAERFFHSRNISLWNHGWSPDYFGTDIHYFFTTREVTKNCPRGRTSTVTLRCGFSNNFISLFNLDPVPFVQMMGSIELPPECPEGTCDGCNFHFMWVTPLACPVCSMDEIRRSFGTCFKGQKRTQLIMPSGCRIVSDADIAKLPPCPILWPSQIAALLSVLALVVGLTLLVYICHRRNKRLQYKYKKLVQTTGGRDQPTSCALEPDAEDSVESMGRRVAPPPPQFDPPPFDFNDARGKKSLILEPLAFIKSSAKSLASNTSRAAQVRFKNSDDKQVLTEHEL